MFTRLNFKAHGSVVFVGYFVRNLVDVIGLVGEKGLELLAATLDALFQAICESAFLEMAQHQVFDIVPKAFLRHVVDALVTEDGEFMVFDGQIDEHAVAQLGLVEFQVVEDVQTPLFHIALAVVFDVDLDLTRGVQLCLTDGLYDTLVFFSVQDVDGVGHSKSFWQR